MAVHSIKLTWWKECLTESASSFLSILELFTFLIKFLAVIKENHFDGTSNVPHIYQPMQDQRFHNGKWKLESFSLLVHKVNFRVKTFIFNLSLIDSKGSLFKNSSCFYNGGKVEENERFGKKVFKFKRFSRHVSFPSWKPAFYINLLCIFFLSDLNDFVIIFFVHI